MNPKDKILRKVWHGRIPVCFRLSPEDLPADEPAPPPFFALIPRMTYFPLVIEKAVRQFHSYRASLSGADMSLFMDEARASPRTGQRGQTGAGGETDTNKACASETCSSDDHAVWLEFDTRPLKWHYPVGLLFDLFGSASSLPWEIYIHFENYPSDILLAPPVNRASVKANFMSTIKEADMLKHRGSVVSEMQPRDHLQLWMGLLNGTFEQFWTVNRRFMQPFVQTNPSANPPTRPTLEDQEAENEPGDSPASETVNITSEDSPNLLMATGTRVFRYCPFRLYFSPLSLEKNIQGSERVLLAEEALDPSEGDKNSGTYLPENLPPYVQCLISPFNESGLPITFSDVLESLFASPALSRFGQLHRQ
ncbi:unnamed protein product, partial [Schistocephalus solidus]|uniref:Autophagy protein 5 n=4 Tax=Schistocephalus solidus TaxID=70667 RepID=A0A183T8G3_SCHSO